MNVYFPSFSVHFRPLPEFNVFPNRFVKLFVGDKVSSRTAAAYINILRGGSLVQSYIFSPNVLIPVQSLELLLTATASYDSALTKTISFLFSAAVLGAVVKFTKDGTLHKLSDDLYSLATNGKNIVSRLETEGFKEVTFIEPPLLKDDPKQMGVIRSAIAFINSIILKIFNCIFFCKERTSA